MISKSLKRLAVGSALIFVFTASRLVSAAVPEAPTHPEFNRDVRPILSDKCFACHGPDKKARQAELRLDLRDEAMVPAESGETPIVPGEPDESEIIRRVMTADADSLMPPPDSHKTLTPRQKEILERWIAEGAKYQQHWSFEPPVRPEVPAGQNAVDFLVRKRLAEIGLKPVAAADRRTLIRRLHFDLLGLPPTPQEVETFVNDADPRAYEKLVERILGNPHYGERMALGWLDVVRFADTIGYHSDEPQNVGRTAITSFVHSTTTSDSTVSPRSSSLVTCCRTHLWRHASGPHTTACC